MPLVEVPQEGQSILDWARGIVALVRAARVKVAPGSGLRCRESADGVTIGLELPPNVYHAEVTAVISLSSGFKLGKGKVKLFNEYFDASDDGYLEPLAGQFTVYFGAPSGKQTQPIAVGERILVTRTISGRLSVCTGYC